MNTLPSTPARTQIDVRGYAGQAQPLAAALYDAFPALAGCSQVISTAGRVRITTLAAIDADAVRAFIGGYLNCLPDAMAPMLVPAGQVKRYQRNLNARMPRSGGWDGVREVVR